MRTWVRRTWFIGVDDGPAVLCTVGGQGLGFGICFASTGFIFGLRSGARAAVGFFVRLPVGLVVAFPAHQRVAFEPDCELAFFFLAVARLVIVRIVPAIGKENIL